MQVMVRVDRKGRSRKLKAIRVRIDIYDATGMWDLELSIFVFDSGQFLRYACITTNMLVR